MLLNKPQKTMILCLVFIAGIGACFLDAIPLLSIISILLATFFVYKKDISLKFSAICLIFFIFAIFYCGIRTPHPDKLYGIAPSNVYLKGSVLTEPKSNLKNRTKFEFQVISYKLEGSKWKDIKAKTIVSIYDKKQKFKNILVGDLLEVKGYIKRPYQATNPGQFDYKNYLKHQGIFTLTNVKYNNFRIIEHPKSGKWFIIQNLNKIKNEIIAKNAKYIKSPKLEIMEGMVFGDYAVPAPEKVKQDFIKSGLLHLLAASGMNVGFIFATWYFIASSLKIPYRFKMATGAVLVAFYSIMTGLPPSIMRASILAEFLILAKIFDRKADTLIILVFVCALMLLINPFLIVNISFQLSFLVTFGLVLYIPTVMEKITYLTNNAAHKNKKSSNSNFQINVFSLRINAETIPGIVSGIVLVPLVAQIWASPLQIFYFNNFSTYSLPANILVVPFVGIITFLGFMGSLFAFIPVIGDFFCMLFDKIAEPFISIVLFISSFISGLPNSLYYLAKPDILAIIVFYGFITVFLFAIKKNFSSKKLNAVILILFLSLLVFVFKNNFDRRLELVFFDVGQGDSILISTPDKKNILVDTGPWEWYLPAKAIIIPYLRNKGINNLDSVVLTHPDNDHVGGALEIFNNIKVKDVFHNGLTEKTKTSLKIKNYILKNKINNGILTDGDSINLDKKIKIKIIRPENINNRDTNEDCIILYITYKDFSALLMADSEAESLFNIQKHVKKPVNIIKIGHHGSYNSLDYNFLNYLSPELAVISVGKKGYKYGHPDNTVLKALDEFNVKTFRTDKDFAITVKTNGENYAYESFKKTAKE